MARNRPWITLPLLLLGACDLPLGGGEIDAGDTPAGEGDLVNFDPQGNRLTRFDTDGDAIDAHGGQIKRFGDTYYLYGESYDCGFGWRTPGTPFCGFRVYSSPDLVHWTDRGALFDATTEFWQSRCSGDTYGCFRPKVAYNESTGRYVLWVNVYDVAVGFRVFESDSPVGPFEQRAVPHLSVNSDTYVWINNGDEDLFVDRDGTAYIVFTDWKSDGDIVVEELSADYLTGTGRFVRLGISRVEAPSLFRRGDRYYITMSDPNCGYCTTGTSFVTAPTPLGPWSGRTKISTNSCGGQPAQVSELPAEGGGSWYLYYSDLWNNGAPNEATADYFWAPLAFDDSGGIQPITCDPSHRAPILVSGDALDAPTEAERYRVLCDVGMHGGNQQRELRFTVDRATRLDSISVTTHQWGSPGAPLTLEFRCGSAAGAVHRIQIAPEQIGWSPREITVPTPAALEPGETYAVRASAELSQGCYGVAFRSDLEPSDSRRSMISFDGGRTWRPAAERVLDLELHTS